MDTTWMRISAAAMGSSGRAYVLRFGRTERAVHWVQAGTFLVLIVTGLALGLTQLETLIGHRALLRQVHLAAAFFFVFGPALVALAGNRRAMSREAAAVDTWTEDDLRWLMHPTVSPDSGAPPAGKYNAGQKLNAIFTLYSTLAFAVTGLILWQNRRFPFDIVAQANLIHTYLAYLALAVFLGHVYLAVVLPATRPSLHGIVLGTVERKWAERHHPHWRYDTSREDTASVSAIVRSVIILLLGSEVVLLLSRAGFEALGANSSDRVIDWLYRLSGLPGTVVHHATGVHSFDIGALVWAGIGVTLWVAVSRGQALLPHTLAVPSRN